MIPTSPCAATCPGPNASTRTVAPGSGHSSMSTQRPSCIARSGAGGVERRTNTRPRAGAHGGPPRRCWSKKRISSWSQSMCGPGRAVDGSLWLHGPASRYQSSMCSMARKVLLR